MALLYQLHGFQPAPEIHEARRHQAGFPAEKSQCQQLLMIDERSQPLIATDTLSGHASSDLPFRHD